MLKIVFVTLLFIFLPHPVFSHGGGLDRCGGHNDRKRGGYHVHRYNRYCSCYPSEQGCSKQPARILSSTKATTKKKNVPKKQKATQKKLNINISRVYPISAGIYEKYELQTNTINTNTQKNTAKRLQIRLKELGYYKGNIDGILGKNSRNAVYNFQKEHNLPKSETIDSTLILKIDEVIANKYTTIKEESKTIETQIISQKPSTQGTEEKIPETNFNQTSLVSNEKRDQTDEGISFNTILFFLFLYWLVFGRRSKK